MLSQKTRYALRALAVLAEHNEPAPLSIQEIAARADAPRKFLEGIDYFVYFHHSQRVEAFGRTIIEAMAAGCVAILPHHFREVFGEGAHEVFAGDVEVLAGVFGVAGGFHPWAVDRLIG